MHRGTPHGGENSTPDVQGGIAGDVVDHPCPQADGSGEQAHDEPGQRIGAIRKILGPVFAPDPTLGQQR